MKRVRLTLRLCHSSLPYDFEEDLKGRAVVQDLELSCRCGAVNEPTFELIHFLPLHDIVYEAGSCVVIVRQQERARASLGYKMPGEVTPYGADTAVVLQGRRKSEIRKGVVVSLLSVSDVPMRLLS